MTLGHSLVPTLVVACQSCHQLLIFGRPDVIYERGGSVTSKRCGNSTVVSDDHVAVAPALVRESVGRWHARRQPTAAPPRTSRPG